MKNFEEKFGIARLVWEEKPPAAWGQSPVEAQHKKDLVQRGDHEPKPPPEPPKKDDETATENPEDEKPIDPGDFRPPPDTHFCQLE